MKIKDIPVLDRPIERLIHNGSSTLNNEELLAILLGTGSKEESAKSLANHILTKTTSIKELTKLTLENLIAIKGIGPKKAATVLAALELSKRINKNSDTILYQKIRNSEDVYMYFEKLLEDKSQEHFYCLYLDIRKRVVANKMLFLGTINYSVVHPREIFLEAYLNHATSIICIHNHPSGEVEPSKEDIELTKRLVKIGSLMGINVNDHIIVGKNQYYSFFEAGKI